MAEYRYVVFPPGAAPSAEELALLRRFADHLNQHIALGTHRGDGGFAIACEAEPFDRLRGLEPAFEELLTHWRARGGCVAEKLAFVKDAKAWKVVQAANAPRAASARPQAARRETPPAAAARDPREAEGRARLATRRFAENVESIERAAAWVPYALWGLGAALVLGVGAYVGVRLSGAGVERRSDTIERVLEDAGADLITPPPAPPRPPTESSPVAGP